MGDKSHLIRSEGLSPHAPPVEIDTRAQTITRGVLWQKRSQRKPCGYTVRVWIDKPAVSWARGPLGGAHARMNRWTLVVDGPGFQWRGIIHNPEKAYRFVQRYQDWIAAGRPDLSRVSLAPRD